MAIDKSILTAALANLRKELRGHKGPVVIQVETSHDEPDDEDAELAPDGDEASPGAGKSSIAAALETLKPKKK
jgi:hypothetical protein